LRRTGPVMAAVAGLAAIVAVVGLSWLAFAKGGLLFDPVYPTLALVAVYLATSLGTYVKAELDRAYVRQAFGHYVAPQLVEQLAADAGSLKLGGEMREVTLLFSDVRGFSHISEVMDAEGLVRFINTLFTPIADVILD
jgi:adenylate cyclase